MKKISGCVILILAVAAAAATAEAGEPQAAKPVLLGQAMPDFKLSSFQGEEVVLSKLAGRNILLIFPRGLAGEKHWCHVCNYQYADLAETEKTAGFRKSLNLEVLFVLPYDRTMVREWAGAFAAQMKDIEAWKNPSEPAKLDEKGKARLDLMRSAFPRTYLYEPGRVPLPFPVLIDEGAKLARSLGVFTTEWGGSKIEQNVPTIFILDAKGTVRFKYISQNTFDRPSTEYLLKFIEWMGK